MRRTQLFLSTAFLLAPATAVHGQDLGFTLPDIVFGTAFRDERAILDTPVATAVREGEDLSRRQATDFQDLIGAIPGVSIDGGPRGISQEPNIRGFRDEQVVLRFDGGRVNFNQAHRGRFFVDPLLVQRVEVVRGGGSTLFGSGALGGVISVETVDAADLLMDGQTTGARVTLGYDSNGNQFNGTGIIFGDFGNVDALLALSGRSVTDNLVDGGGDDIPFSEIDQGNALVKFGFEPNADNRFEFSYNLYQDMAD
ncbi:MAG: TonB-dependent receptor plug domain-containing protein, partial [Planctomycetota bacterium]